MGNICSKSPCTPIKNCRIDLIYIQNNSLFTITEQSQSLEDTKETNKLCGEASLSSSILYLE